MEFVIPPSKIVNIRPIRPTPKWAKQAFHRASSRERARGTEPSLSARRIYRQFNVQGGRCSNCNVRLVTNRKFTCANAPQVDRINTTRRQYRGNMTLLCAYCNGGKSGFDLLDQVRAEYGGGKRLPSHGTCSACNKRLRKQHFHANKLDLDECCTVCKPVEELSIEIIGIRADMYRRYTAQNPSYPAVDARRLWTKQHGRCYACGGQLSLRKRCQTLATVCPENFDSLICHNCLPETFPWKGVDKYRG